MQEVQKYKFGSITVLIDDNKELHASLDMPPGLTDELLEDIRTIFLDALDQGIVAYQQEYDNGD